MSNKATFLSKAALYGASTFLALFVPSIALSVIERERTYSDKVLGEMFLNGVDRSTLKSLSHYAFGNAAGMATVARVTAPPDVLYRIVQGTASWGRKTPRDAEEGITCAESIFSKKQAPEWYQLKADEPVECFRRFDGKVFTFYYRKSPDTLYVHHVEI